MMKSGAARSCVLTCVSVFFIGISSAGIAAPPPGKGKPGGNDNDGTTASCSYPSFSDSPKDKLSGDEADFFLKYGSIIDAITLNVDNSVKNPVFSEEGSLAEITSDSSGHRLNGQWFIEDMIDNQHRVPGDAEEGRRYSGWYDWLAETNLGTDNSQLLASDGFDLKLGGYASALPDPRGLPGFGTKLYTTWISTFQRKNIPDNFGTAKDGSIAFQPPFYFETKVDLSMMQTPGFRLSMWLMPVETSQSPVPDGSTPSIAYDGDFKNGYEIDIFEYEPVKVLPEVVDENGVVQAPEDVCGNLIEFSWINSFSSGKGKAASNANGKNHFEGDEEGYCTDGTCSSSFAFNGIQKDLNDIDIEEDNLIFGSEHTISLLWTDEVIAWAFNGEIVLEIAGNANISTEPHYLIVSREMTNGNTGADSALPVEPGLYGFNGNSDIGNYIDYINDDRALIDWIRVWANVVSYPE